MLLTPFMENGSFKAVVLETDEVDATLQHSNVCGLPLILGC